jgi:AcrR family transcriptional regulator
VPTGIALPDAREQLFDAAERVLLREGANALTSRSVTAEAGVAKGVLHRHFADFDAFLFELVQDRLAGLGGPANALLESAGTGMVADNITHALIALFRPVAVAIVALVISRDGLRARLRQSGASRVPLLSEGTAMVASYLKAEQDLGRVAVDADVDTLAHMLIGTAQLLFADREGPPPDQEAVHKVVATVLAGVLQNSRS